MPFFEVCGALHHDDDDDDDSFAIIIVVVMRRDTSDDFASVLGLGSRFATSSSPQLSCCWNHEQHDEDDILYESTDDAEGTA